MIFVEGFLRAVVCIYRVRALIVVLRLLSVFLYFLDDEERKRRREKSSSENEKILLECDVLVLMRATDDRFLLPISSSVVSRLEHYLSSLLSFA